MIKKGEFAYNKSYSKGFPWGTIKRLNRYNMGVLSTLYIIFKPTNVDSNFLEKYYDTNYWHKEISMIATEGARNHGLLNIAPSDFFDSKLIIPVDKTEQYKVGNILKKLDELIDLYQNQLLMYEGIRKYMLQNLFPKDKANVPNVRFADFVGDWEQQLIGNLLNNLYNGQTPSRSDNLNWNGNISWLSSGELNKGTVLKTVEKITPEGKSEANLKIVPSGTFVMAITGLEAKGTRGNCAILGINTTLNQSCMALFPNKSKLISGFLFQWYMKFGDEYGIRYTQGTKQQSYNAELIKILPIKNPNITEQKVIVSLLTKLDELIKIQKRQLTLYENIKKYYIQKLFI